jgi:hypothetical protein
VTAIAYNSPLQVLCARVWNSTCTSLLRVNTCNPLRTALYQMLCLHGVCLAREVLIAFVAEGATAAKLQPPGSPRVPGVVSRAAAGHGVPTVRSQLSFICSVLASSPKTQEELARGRARRELSAGTCRNGCWRG